MKFILIFLLLFSPARHVEQIDVKIVTEQNSIFPDLENDNFKQNVSTYGKIVNIMIENSNYLDLNLNHRLFINTAALNSSDKYIKQVFHELYNENISLRIFLQNISFYLRDNIKYWGDSPFKTPEDVIIYKKTNCIGYSALVKELLAIVDIRTNFVSGFYLKKTKKNSYDPVPHRWLELFIPGSASFYFDPQYQGFKANYIVVSPGHDFRTIKKFKINFLHREKKFIN
ncbi:MAG: transglutaminase domain-containing protein [Acidobacteriota bacterium]